MVEEFMHDEIVRAGFTDVVRVRFKWPIGGWSNDPRLKELGKWVLVHWNEGLEGWVLRFFTKHMGVSDPLNTAWRQRSEPLGRVHNKIAKES